DEMKEIMLSYRVNFFSFDFVSPEYRHPDRIQYAYKLENYNKEWVSCGSIRHADYTDISDGQYVFRVKSWNPDGAVSETSIRMIIIPPFWRTMWFKVLAICLILLSPFTFIQLRTRTIRKRNRQLETFNQQLQQEIAERQQAEILQATLYQIAEITHSDMEFDEIYRSIHQSISSLIDTGNFYIALYDHTENTIFLPYFVDQYDDYMGRMLKSFKGLTEYIIRNNKSLLASQSVLHEMISNGEICVFGTMPKIWLGVPLRFKDEIFGAVVVQHYSNPNAYTEKDKKMLEFASDQIAGVLYRKREAEEKRELKEKLVLSEKMEAIGRLAGGVAHDLNNVLSAIVSYPELLLIKLPSDSPMRKPLLTIKQSGQRAAAIVQDLLTLARRGVDVKEVVNWNTIIDDYLMSPVFERLMDGHPEIKVEVNLDTNLLNIEGSPVHLAKTIMNLCSNAAEAMPRGGTINLATCNLFHEEDIVDYGISNFVVVSISDTGIGIAKNDLKRIFEPFYTRKEMGISGTGLGMTIVWNTVHDHNGFINIYSEEGKGTVFELYFPITHAAVSKKKKPVNIEEFKGKGERILVIDDMLEQREILSAILAELGYSAKCVARGEDAVNYIQAHGEDVVLLVLDMMMESGMDGLDTYKEILKIKPGLKAIIASGYSETARVKEAVKLGAGAYIKKPYTLEKIGLALKRELEK
ncbi:MAG TPA: ATP-binding protein, partial [Candidatus Deferrimicrobium sp.]|nr:ATP-binding protein [Candidatus Deferrimicrobium sp.]